MLLTYGSIQTSRMAKHMISLTLCILVIVVTMGIHSFVHDSRTTSIKIETCYQRRTAL